MVQYKEEKFRQNKRREHTDIAKEKTNTHTIWQTYTYTHTVAHKHTKAVRGKAGQKQTIQPRRLLA